MIIFGYIVFFTKEVDDVAENGPIQSQIISKIDQIPLFEGMLAASISRSTVVIKGSASAHVMKR